MPLSIFLLPRQTRRVASVAMLVLVLLWAQTWGQWHSVVHAQHGVTGLARVAVQGPGHVELPTSPAASAQTFFEHDAGDAQCRLLDQLSHADSVPCVPLLVLPLGLSAALVAQCAGLAVARWAALFQARAPPSLR